jgi:hypothetical protein
LSHPAVTTIAFITWSVNLVHDGKVSTLSDCPVGIALLQKFCACIEKLFWSVGKANNNHSLAVFAEDSIRCIRDDKDVCEKFNEPLNGLLHKPLNKL